MKGIEFAEVRDAILSAFSPDEFDMLLYERLDFDRAVDGPFKVVVTNTLQKAQREAWDPSLIAETAAVRPLKPNVQHIYTKYAQVLVDEARQHAVDAAQLKAIEKYRTRVQSAQIHLNGRTIAVPIFPRQCAINSTMKSPR